MKKGSGTITLTTTISLELWSEAKKADIKWSEALRRGVSMLLSNKGVEGYDNPLNLQRKIENLVKKLEIVVKENEELRSK